MLPEDDRRPKHVGACKYPTYFDVLWADPRKGYLEN
jgi:hypothetical protein